MSRIDEKGKRFEFLIGRVDEARDNGYFIEAMAITYALMEERTYALLDRLGIQYRNRDKLFQCLEYLRNSIIGKTITIIPIEKSTDDLIDWLKIELLNSGLIDNIQIWRDKRNDVIHDLAKTTINYSDLEETCNNGSSYFRKYTAFIMKLKKML